MGQLATLDELRDKYGVDAVHWAEDAGEVLVRMKPACLHVLRGENTDRWGTRCRAEYTSPAFKHLFKVNPPPLRPLVNTCFPFSCALTLQPLLNPATRTLPLAQ